MSYHPRVIAAAHEAVLADIDTGTGTAVVQCRTGAAAAITDAPAGTLLGTIALANPCGTVDAGTGQATFNSSTRDESADAAGTIGHIVLLNGAGDPVFSLPAKAGTAAESGWAVFKTTTVVAGAPIELLSITLG